MDETYVGVVRVKAWVVLHVPGDGVEERAIEIAKAWVYYKVRLFVDEYYIFVLIDDVNRDVLWDNRVIGLREIQYDSDDIVWFDAVTGFDGYIIDKDVLRVGSLLNAVAGGAGHYVGKILVNAKKRLPTVNDEAEMFVEFAGKFEVVFFSVLSHG